jgi:hypothetical protein
VLKAKDGNILQSGDEILKRWTEHFREVLFADINFPDGSSSWESMPSDPPLSLLTSDQALLVRSLDIAEVESAVKKWVTVSLLVKMG